MRKGFVGLLLAFGMALQASGQLKGLPVGDTAAPEEGGPYRVSVSATSVDAGYAVGVRCGVALTQDVRLFAGAGAVRPENADDTPGLQLGALYCVPLQLPVDLALRAALYYVDDYRTAKEDVSEFGFSLMVLSSGRFRDLDPNLQGYCGIGLSRAETDRSARRPGGGDRSGGETDPTFVGGLLYQVGAAVSVYAELGYQDQLAAGIGLRFDL